MTPRSKSYEVRVPASSANLGAGFDCFGLALDLHLTVCATVLTARNARSQISSTGVAGTSRLPRAPGKNLIFRAMNYMAEREGFRLPPLRLAVHNEIPLAAGLGSSAAAIVAGIALGAAACGRKLSDDAVLAYAAAIEHHADNVAAALLGGLAVTLIRPDGSVVAARKDWPAKIRGVVVTPSFALETSKARAALPRKVSHADAVHNLQRSALFLAALDARRYDLIWDAMQDRLHQDYRRRLIPGLENVLAMPCLPGLLGIALSGAGPSVIALATENFDQIGAAIASHFRRRGLTTEIRTLSVARHGLTLKRGSSHAHHS